MPARHRRKRFRLKSSPNEPETPGTRPAFVAGRRPLPAARRLIAVHVSRGLERFAIAEIRRELLSGSGAVERPLASMLYGAAPGVQWPVWQRTADEAAFEAMQPAAAPPIAPRVDADPQKSVDSSVCSDEMLPAFEWGQRLVLTFARLTGNCMAGVGDTVLLFVRPVACAPERILSLRLVEHAVAVVLAAVQLAEGCGVGAKMPALSGSAASRVPPLAVLRAALDEVRLPAWADAWRVWRRVCLGCAEDFSAAATEKVVEAVAAADAAALASLEPTTLRVTCFRGGVYRKDALNAWTSMDAARAVAGSFLSRDAVVARGWAGMVSLEEYAAEVLVFVGNVANVIVGLRLSLPQGLHRRHRLRYADGFEEPSRGDGGVGTVNVALKSSVS